MQTGTRQQAQSRASPPDQQKGKTVTTPNANTARAEEEERCYRLRRGHKVNRQQTRPTEAWGNTCGLKHPHMPPQVHSQWPGRGPPERACLSTHHPRCAHWELTVQGPKTDAGPAQGDPWLPGLPLAQPTLCEGANSVAEKLRQHSISFQTNHFFFFFFLRIGGKEAYPYY